MKKAAFILVGVTCLLAGFGVYWVFAKFNRYSNPNAKRPELIIYTHSSFMDAYGPGPELKKRFEELCLCDVRYVDAGGGVLLLERLKLEAGKQVDLVLGFDQLILKSAVQAVEWKQVKLPEIKTLDIFNENKYETFVAYDWSPMTFISKGEGASTSENLMRFLQKQEDKSLTVPSPITSTPGQLFALWLYDLSNRDQKTFEKNLAALKAKMKIQGADWSASYGMFRKDQVSAAWSFVTSLLYHQDQNESGYRAEVFSSGHPIHLDYAGIPQSCLSCGLAQRFITFLLEPEQQNLLVQKNYMRPVIPMDIESLNQLPEVKAYKFSDLDELVDQKDEIIRTWSKMLQ